MDEPLSHRALAVANFNRSWELLEMKRSAGQDLELLEVAFASRHHWRIEGGAQQAAVADWMVARCFSVLDDGPMAVRFASSALHRQPPDAAPWLRASLLEGLARAHAANGDQAARDEACASAATELALETDADDAAVIAEQLASVPDAT